MNAKDTVMSDDMIKSTIRFGNILSSERRLVESQAEISFEAGIKEVVEFVLAHSQLERCDPDVMTYFIDYLAIDYPDWQAKLKEWGVAFKSKGE